VSRHCEFTRHDDYHIYSEVLKGGNNRQGCIILGYQLDTILGNQFDTSSTTSASMQQNFTITGLLKPPSRRLAPPSTSNTSFECSGCQAS
jgi:hypothetical protein